MLRLTLCMFIASILVGVVWGLYDARQKRRQDELDRAAIRRYAQSNLSHDSILTMCKRVEWPTTDDAQAAWDAYDLAQGIQDAEGR